MFRQGLDCEQGHRCAGEPRVAGVVTTCLGGSEKHVKMKARHWPGLHVSLTSASYLSLKNAVMVEPSWVFIVVR